MCVCCQHDAALPPMAAGTLHHVLVCAPRRGARARGRAGARARGRSRASARARERVRTLRTSYSQQMPGMPSAER